VTVTDPNVRNVLFDPRCGWVLISGGVYLGTTRILSRSQAMGELSIREVRYGLREKGVRTRNWEDTRQAMNHSYGEYERAVDFYRALPRYS
jgi:hypothetical protein